MPTKISLLPAATDAVGDELVPVVQGGVTKKIPILFSKADHDKLVNIEAGAQTTNTTRVAAAGAEILVLWNSTTDTWAARPTAAIAPRVKFSSTDDPTATAPTDINLQPGDTWEYAL